MKRLILALLFGIAATVCAATSSLACAICYGESGNPLTEGVSAGVLVLLGVIVAVLGWFTWFIVYFVRRSRRVTRDEMERTESAQMAVPQI